jgi:hypothetical protein
MPPAGSAQGRWERATDRSPIPSRPYERTPPSGDLNNVFWETSREKGSGLTWTRSHETTTESDPFT